MPYPIRLLGAAALVVAIGTAAQAGDPPLALPQDELNICAAFGAGFHAVPGTDTCLRTGGSVRVDSGYVGGDLGAPAGNAGFDRWSSNARGNVRLETRTQTDFGVVRIVIEGETDLGADERRTPR